MASVYHRFSGNINTNASFPALPEASHLLGGRVSEEENAGKTPRPCQDPRSRVLHHKRSQYDDEDVSETIYSCPLHSQYIIFIRTNPLYLLSVTMLYIADILHNSISKT